MAHDIFISYSNKDENVVRAVSNALEAQKIRCWYASRDIPAGAEWASSIMNAIKEAKALLLIFTDYSNESGQVRREVNNAISYGIPVIPFKLTPNNPSGGMEYYLSTVHWLDAVDQPLDDAIQNLVIRVKRVIWEPDIESDPPQPPTQRTEAGVTPPSKRWYKTAIPILLGVAIILGVLFATGILPPNSTSEPVAPAISSPSLSPTSTPSATQEPALTPSPSPTPTSSPSPSPSTTASSSVASKPKELMADVCLETEVEKAAVYSVFSNENIRREQILSITFLDSVNDMPENSWDVSKEGSYGQVKAWVQQDSKSGLYHLYIAAPGGVAAPSDCSGLFNGYTNLERITFGNSFSTSNVTNMSFMFFNCVMLSDLDLHGFDTSSTTRMSSMFYSCSSLQALDLSSFNTSSVTKMGTMFFSCSSLHALDISNFDTSTVTDMGNMFSCCSSLERITLGENFRTGNVTSMKGMFQVCTALKELDLSSFDTSSVTDMQYMFRYCSSLERITLGENFFTGNVTTMEGMFEGCIALKELDVSGFDTSKVEEYDSFMPDDLNPNWRNLFEKASAPKELMADTCLETEVKNAAVYSVFSNENIRREQILSITFLDTLSDMPQDAWDVSKEGAYGQVKAWVQQDSKSGLYHLFIAAPGGVAAPSDCSGLFNGYTNLERITFGDSFSTSNVTNMRLMFFNCVMLSELDISRFNTHLVTSMASMFYGCGSLTELDLCGFDTSSLTNMSTMFYECTSLEKILLGGFNTSSVTNMANTFANCNMLKELDLSSFDTSSVTKMSYMFNECSSVSDLDLSNFDTSKVTTMKGMFNGCNSINNLDLNNFDTSKVTTMKGMFMDCSSLEALTINSFDTSSVTDMFGMFFGCRSLKELNVNSFDTSKVTTMKGMFKNCSSLTSLDVSGFNTEKVIDMTQMFFGCDALKNLDVSGFDTSKVEEYDTFMPDSLNPNWREMFQKS